MRAIHLRLSTLIGHSQYFLWTGTSHFPGIRSFVGTLAVDEFERVFFLRQISPNYLLMYCRRSW